MLLCVCRVRLPFTKVFCNAQVQDWAAMRSGCVLDLALRVLLLWINADRHDLASSWVADQVKLARSAAAYTGGTAEGETTTLHQEPSSSLLWTELQRYPVVEAAACTCGGGQLSLLDVG